jgi:hypothetical protein
VGDNVRSLNHFFKTEAAAKNREGRTMEFKLMRFVATVPPTSRLPGSEKWSKTSETNVSA